MGRYVIGRREPARGLDLSGLNLQQQAVVAHPPGGQRLVIAGPGSGKTRTLTYRVANLIAMGVPPERLLLLTFTNRAAREMLERVEQLVPEDAWRVHGGTFHSVGNRLLRRHAAAIGYQPDFTILDRGDAEEQVGAAILDLGIDTMKRRFPRKKVVLNLFSACINQELSLQEAIFQKAPQFQALLQPLQDVAQRYVERKRAANQLDFDDLLVGWSLLADPPPEANEALRAASAEVCGLYREVLVDEYQDVNAIQGRIADGMASVHGGLTVVGDDCQSIYRFRGADDQNILAFEARHPEAERFYLTINYRSRPEILAVANQSITHNPKRFIKDLEPVRESNGMRPWLSPLRDRRMQATFVAERILDLRDEGIPLNEIAVLYRAHHHATELQVELTRRGIPFMVRSGLRFFEQAHIKDVLSFLRVLHNRRDELSFHRALMTFDAIGPATIRRVFERVHERLTAGADPLAEFEQPVWGNLVGARGAKSWQAVVKLFGQLVRLDDTKVTEMIWAILDSPYADHVRYSYSNPQARLEDLQQLADYAANFDGLHQFLAELALLDTFQAEEVVESEEPDEKVSLSSIHQAKGLEWSRVFVLCMNDGLFPMATALREPGGEEEERRLFYVATTRAKDELYLTYTEIREGRRMRQDLLAVSRFIRELQGVKNSQNQPLLDRVEVVFNTDPGLEAPKETKALEGD
ncbi:MAG: ATP-dependent helicase [Myxococcota bacterium]|nr:ATP-dependent helicase [Myxococcota bacterium]